MLSNRNKIFSLFKDAKVRVKLLIGFGIILAMMLFNTVTNFYNLVIMESSTEIVTQDIVPLSRLIEEIGTELANEEADVRGYIASGGDTRFLESYNSSNKNIDLIFKEMSKYYSKYPALASIVENEVTPNIIVIRKNFDSQINLVKAGEVMVAQDRLADGKIFMDVYRHVHNKMRDQIKQISIEEQNNSVTAGLHAKWNMAIVLLISIIVSIIITLVLSRVIADRLYNCVDRLEKIAEGNLAIEPLDFEDKDEIGKLGIAINRMLESLRDIVYAVSENSRQVAASSEELSASAEESAQAANQVAMNITEVSQGVENQAKTSEEISIVIEQVTNEVRETATTISSISNLSTQTSQAAKAGSYAVEKAVDQMAAIKQSTKSVGDAVAKLNNNSIEIGQIVNTISNIADQTNLLALNAAIEAARAGEQGRGFSVVAEEVRLLAEQSQLATKEITKLISQIQDDTKTAVLAMDKGKKETEKGIEVVSTAGQAFGEIKQKIDEVSSQIIGTSATLQQLDASSQQIVASIREIDRISKEAAMLAQKVSATTQEQSASTEEIASSSDNLARMAQELQNTIGRFRV